MIEPLGCWGRLRECGLFFMKTLHRFPNKASYIKVNFSKHYFDEKLLVFLHLTAQKSRQISVKYLPAAV